MKKVVRLNNSWLGSFFILILISLTSQAVVCGDLPVLSVEQCGHYDFIAYGRIDSELDCEDGMALFTPVSVFKGTMDKSIEVYTACEDNGLPVSKGEYWILYGDFNNAQEVNLNVCGHSRKQLPKGEVDYQSDVRGSTFQEDLSFLRANFKPKVQGERELLPKKYQKMDPVMVPVLLGAGLLFMIVGYFFIRKKK